MIEDYVYAPVTAPVNRRLFFAGVPSGGPGRHTASALIINYWCGI